MMPATGCSWVPSVTPQFQHYRTLFKSRESLYAICGKTSTEKWQLVAWNRKPFCFIRIWSKVHHVTLQCPENFLHFLQSENIGSPDGDPVTCCCACELNSQLEHNINQKHLEPKSSTISTSCLFPFHQNILLYLQSFVGIVKRCLHRIFTSINQSKEILDFIIWLVWSHRRLSRSARGPSSPAFLLFGLSGTSDPG